LCFFGWDRIKKQQRILFGKRLALMLVSVGFVGGVAYYPIINHLRRFVGGSTFYSMDLLAFFDYPAWHSSSFIQQLRQYTSGFIDTELLRSPSYIGKDQFALLLKPENLMGFFGLSLMLLLWIGWRQGSFKGQKIWGGLAVVGIILSLGPFLQVAGKETLIPLPYLLVDRLPILGSFRAPSRLILLTWLGVSVLAGVIIKDFLGKGQTQPFKICILAAILTLFSWEMGLSTFHRWGTKIEMGQAYQMVKNDQSEGAIFELPIAIHKSGDISINAQKYLLQQPFHQKPLVLGRPPRHTEASLSFCQNTDFVYELTHPHVIPSLNSDPKLKARLEIIQLKGRDILKENKIRYVLYHTRDPFFSSSLMEETVRFIKSVLGPPLLEDEEGILLFKVY